MPFPVQHPDDAYYSPEKGDVWALGVILVNLIARCNPWARGSNADHGFMEYRRDPNFFSKTLPISYSVQALLHRIFVLDPEERITVAELRKAIEAIDTFFLSDMQLSLAGDLVKELDEAYKLNLPRPRVVSSTGSLIDTKLLLCSATSERSSVVVLMVTVNSPLALPMSERSSLPQLPPRALYLTLLMLPLAISPDRWSTLKW